MKDGWFITGTDTGVGKTVLSAALLLRAKEEGRRAVYMKPVQTGCEPDDGRRCAPDVDTCYRLSGMPRPAEEDRDISPYRLLMPASPHLAAAREGVTISLDRIMDSFHNLQSRHDRIIVEGAGGVLVPLNEQDTMLDLMQRMQMPVIVACRAGLGTLNHTLLTLRALRDAGLTVAGLVPIQTTAAAWADIEADNQATLQRMGHVPVLGLLTYQPELAKTAAGPDILRSCVRWMPPDA